MIWTIPKSGVHSKLLSISYTLLVRPESEASPTFGPRRVRIEGKFLIQSILLLGGLVLSSYIFIIELCRKIKVGLHFLFKACDLDLVVKHYSLKCQKTLLIWLNILPAKKDKLLYSLRCFEYLCTSSL